MREPLTHACGRFSLMSCVFHRLRHRWFPGLTRKAFLGGLRPPRTPQFVGRCRGLRRPGGPHGHRFGRPLSRPPKASVWGQVQDQPRSACLVRMIWVKDQHAQQWPWTLSKKLANETTSGGLGAVLVPTWACPLSYQATLCLLYTSPSPRDRG